jgi:hypothetical protein
VNTQDHTTVVSDNNDTCILFSSFLDALQLNLAEGSKFFGLPRYMQKVTLQCVSARSLYLYRSFLIEIEVRGSRLYAHAKLDSFL